jgi:hypothetical protein
MGGVCGMYGGRRGASRFSWGNLKERNHLKNLGVNGNIKTGLN